MDRESAYSQANSLDAQINDILSAYPITSRNWQHWLLFVRVLSTTLIVLEDRITQARREM